MQTNPKRIDQKYIGRKLNRLKPANSRISRPVLITIIIVVGLLCAASIWQRLIDTGALYSKPLVQTNPEAIPEYTDQDYVILQNNVPGFSDYDFQHLKGERYSPLDALGRCGNAFSLLHKSMMPTEERGSIGQIQPTGWQQAKYPGIVESNPPYLYNRCHLIAYMFTGQNANEQNLITGTRYFNVTVMLPWEEKVAKYLEKSSNHVLYRVTPYFKDTELAARGVEIEAYSLEDEGAGICFHVFLYNRQPGIEINYQTGKSKIK